MKQNDLIERLRNPQKFQQPAHSTTKAKLQQTTVQPKAAAPQQTNRLLLIAGGGIFFLVLISLLFIFSAQNRADNITKSLDPNVLKGLVAERTFNPKSERKYVQISEGADRNAVVKELGSTLPVVSRYNYRALTEKNYEVIGAAPWALSINVSANIEDAQLLRYLFNQKDVIKAFLKRTDVAPLLSSEKALAQAAANEKALQAFFTEETVQQVLASDRALQALTGSLLFANLLTSKSVSYYRKNPAQAARLIQNSPTLRSLKRNPQVRKAVAQNKYLKDISATLLK